MQTCCTHINERTKESLDLHKELPNSIEEVFTCYDQDISKIDRHGVPKYILVRTSLENIEIHLFGLTKDSYNCRWRGIGWGCSS